MSSFRTTIGNADTRKEYGNGSFTSAAVRGSRTSPPQLQQRGRRNQHGQLDDADVADIVSYITQTWGSEATEISLKFVEATRAKL